MTEQQTDIRYELTLAGPEAKDVLAKNIISNGAYYALGKEAANALEKHPLARAELGKPKRFDHIHLSIVTDTDFIRWMGRAGDGFHHQIGRTMKLLRIPIAEGASANT